MHDLFKQDALLKKWSATIAAKVADAHAEGTNGHAAPSSHPATSVLSAAK